MGNIIAEYLLRISNFVKQSFSAPIKRALEQRACYRAWAHVYMKTWGRLKDHLGPLSSSNFTTPFFWPKWIIGRASQNWEFQFSQIKGRPIFQAEKSIIRDFLPSSTTVNHRRPLDCISVNSEEREQKILKSRANYQQMGSSSKPTKAQPCAKDYKNQNSRWQTADTERWRSGAMPGSHTPCRTVL